MIGRLPVDRLRTWPCLEDGVGDGEGMGGGGGKRASCCCEGPDVICGPLSCHRCGDGGGGGCGSCMGGDCGLNHDSFARSMGERADATGEGRAGDAGAEQKGEGGTERGRRGCGGGVLHMSTEDGYPSLVRLVSFERLESAQSDSSADSKEADELDAVEEEEEEEEAEIWRCMKVTWGAVYARSLVAERRASGGEMRARSIGFLCGNRARCRGRDGDGGAPAVIGLVIGLLSGIDVGAWCSSTVGMASGCDDSADGRAGTGTGGGGGRTKPDVAPP